MRDLTSFRLLVTASRTWDNDETIFKALEGVAYGAEGGEYSRLIVVHGACPKGGDAAADWWVRNWSADFPVTAERHPALWKKFGKRAGIVRNELMVSRGADLVLAFIRDNSPGATHCAELAMEVGMPVRLWRYGVTGVESFDSRHLTDEEVAGGIG